MVDAGFNHLERVRCMKERLAYMAQNYVEECNMQHMEHVSYELPDGQVG
jgi:hypothetical protein